MEFALIAITLFLFVFGTIDFGRAYQLQNRLSNAAREGAAFAQYQPLKVQGCAGEDDIVDRVTREDPDLPDHPDFAVVVNKRTGTSPDTWSGPITGCNTSSITINAGDVLRIRVTGTFAAVTPLTDAFLPDTTITRDAKVVFQG